LDRAWDWSATDATDGVLNFTNLDVISILLASLFHILVLGACATRRYWRRGARMPLNLILSALFVVRT
jgi:hypothetical protein